MPREKFPSTRSASSMDGIPFQGKEIQNDAFGTEMAGADTVTLGPPPNASVAETDVEGTA